MKNKKRITLFTGPSGRELYDKGHFFLASTQRRFITDHVFTVDVEDLEEHGRVVIDEENPEKDYVLYDVQYLDSIIWDT